MDYIDGGYKSKHFRSFVSGTPINSWIIHRSASKCSTVQVNNNDQTFTCNSNIPVQCPTQSILHSTLLLGLPHGQLHHAHMGFVPPPGPADVQITPQMIFSNINDTNQRLELSMHERLSKLDMLDTLNLKLGHFEKNIVTIKTEIDNIKATQQKQSQILNNEEQHHHNIGDRIRKLEHSNMNLEKENLDLQEQFLELKTHSMKYNLIFTGFYILMVMKKILMWYCVIF